MSELLINIHVKFNQRTNTNNGETIFINIALENADPAEPTPTTSISGRAEVSAPCSSL